MRIDDESVSTVTATPMEVSDLPGASVKLHADGEAARRARGLAHSWHRRCVCINPHMHARTYSHAMYKFNIRVYVAYGNMYKPMHACIHIRMHIRSTSMHTYAYNISIHICIL